MVIPERAAAWAINNRPVCGPIQLDLPFPPYEIDYDDVVENVGTPEREKKERPDPFCGKVCAKAWTYCSTAHFLCAIYKPLCLACIVTAGSDGQYQGPS